MRVQRKQPHERQKGELQQQSSNGEQPQQREKPHSRAQRGCDRGGGRAWSASGVRGLSERSEAIIQNARFVPPEGASADPGGEPTKPRGLAEGEERRAEKGAPHAENEASEQHNQPTARAGRKNQRPR